jgi:5-methylthioadenosine/S-adenosylhomocysteine deaminase
MPTKGTNDSHRFATPTRRTVLRAGAALIATPLLAGAASAGTPHPKSPIDRFPHMNGNVVIKNGRVLQGDPARADFRPADIRIQNGQIVEIAADIVDDSAETLDAQGGYVLPGFVDTHHHLWETTMRGLTTDWDIMDFTWGIRLNNAALHEAEDVASGTLAGALSALDAGTTTVLDFNHCVNTPDHADAAIEAITEAGIRAVWCYGFQDSVRDTGAFSGFAARRDDIERLRKHRFSANGSDALVSLGIGVNEVGGVPWERTGQEYALARQLDLLLTSHTNSTWSAPPAPEIEWLSQAGLLGPRQVHGHANTTTDEQFRMLADAGAAIASSPETELQMGIGFPVFWRARMAGIKVGLGADIQANNGPDMLAQLRIAMQAENARLNQPVLEQLGVFALDGAPVTARAMFRMATLGGAEVLGLESVIGSIEIGKAADLLIMRSDGIHQRPNVDDFGTIVMQSRTGDIDTVMVNGRVVKRAGRLVHVDIAAVNARADQTFERLAERFAANGGSKPPRPEALQAQMARMFMDNLSPLFR